MTPGELLASAHELINRPGAATTGVWPRAAAMLARQALEGAVDTRWAAQAQTVGMAQATMRSQLICLPEYLDAAVARQVTFAYAALTRACHYHPYELAPTAAELTRWICDVEALVAQIEAAAS